MNSIVYIIAPTAFPPIVFYVIGICPFIGFLLFLVFIKKLSEYIGRYDLAARSKTVLIVFLIYFGESRVPCDTFNVLSRDICSYSFSCHVL